MLKKRKPASSPSKWSCCQLWLTLAREREPCLSDSVPVTDISPQCFTLGCGPKVINSSSSFMITQGSNSRLHALRLLVDGPFHTYNLQTSMVQRFLMGLKPILCSQDMANGHLQAHGRVLDQSLVWKPAAMLVKTRKHEGKYHCHWPDWYASGRKDVRAHSPFLGRTCLADFILCHCMVYNVLTQKLQKPTSSQWPCLQEGVPVRCAWFQYVYEVIHGQTISCWSAFQQINHSGTCPAPCGDGSETNGS